LGDSAGGEKYFAGFVLSDLVVGVLLAVLALAVGAASLGNVHLEITVLLAGISHIGLMQPLSLPSKGPSTTHSMLVCSHRTLSILQT
jgi:hypothetical protein